MAVSARDLFATDTGGSTSTMEGGARKLFICDNIDCCSRGSLDLMEKIEDRLDAREDAAEVEVERYTCFGGCDIGPNMIVHPDHVMYSGVQEKDLDEIVDHLCGTGNRVSRLETADQTTKGFIFSILDAGGWGSF
jgi:(2Fe-2S) ferredoxin